MEKYVSYRVLRKVNDTNISNCYFAHRLFSFSLMLLTTQSLLHFMFQFLTLIWNIFKPTVENQEFYMKILDFEKKGFKKRQICENA